MKRSLSLMILSIASLSAQDGQKPAAPPVDPAKPVEIPATVQARYWRAVAMRLSAQQMLQQADATAKAAEAELRAACKQQQVADQGGVLVCQ